MLQSFNIAFKSFNKFKINKKIFNIENFYFSFRRMVRCIVQMHKLMNFSGSVIPLITHTSFFYITCLKYIRLDYDLLGTLI